MFCLNSLLLTKKKMVTTPVTKASDSPSQGLIKYIIYFFETIKINAANKLTTNIQAKNNELDLFFFE